MWLAIPFEFLPLVGLLVALAILKIVRISHDYVKRRIERAGGRVELDIWDDTYFVKLTSADLLWCLSSLKYLIECNWLDLSSTSISNADVKYLRCLRKSLEMLVVSDTCISNDFVHGLSRFPRLYSLNLARTIVSDDCIAALATIPELRWVDLSGTDCTVEGIDRLRQLKPTCHILTGFIDDRFQAE